MSKHNLRRRLNYWFDNLMARGTIMHIAWLFIFSAMMIFSIAALARFTEDGQQVSLMQLAWNSLMRTLDPGTMGGDEGSWPYLFLMFTITLGGIFVVGTLIGIITNGIDEKLTALRKGRSIVIESGHTVILGWSNQIFSIISELVVANQNIPRACIAILANKSKVDMEDELRDRIGPTGNTRLVCRTGDPIELANLEIINPSTARSVIILPPDSDIPDAQVIKLVLALSHHFNKSDFHIVAEFQNSKNLEVARLVGGDRGVFIQANELIARITAQTCRQSGLSVVYNEILDFEGDEIYFQLEASLFGKTFGMALLAYEDSCVIGLRVRDGIIRLNPPMDTIIEPGDAIIAISADDDTVRVSGLTNAPVNENAIQHPVPSLKGPEHTLILGWNHLAPMIVKELDNYVAPDSGVLIVADVQNSIMESSFELENIKNQKVSFIQGDSTDRQTLDKLDIPNFQHVIVLSYSDQLDTQQADARTLMTLLHLRDIGNQSKNRFSIVSEMLDFRNRELAEIARPDDFIVSDRLISLMLSQISENKELIHVFDDLFNPQGSEIYLKPAGDYVHLGTPTNFYTVVESARRRDQVALGYRLNDLSHDPRMTYGVMVNPDKSELVTFSEQDRIIVLSEE